MRIARAPLRRPARIESCGASGASYPGLFARGFDAALALD